MPEGSTLSPHTHTKEDEIFHVLEGSVEVILGNELIKGVKGDIIYLPRGIKHGELWRDLSLNAKSIYRNAIVSFLLSKS